MPTVAFGSATVHPDATLSGDVVLGAGVVIHAGVVLGAGVQVGDGAILGKPPTVSARSSAPRTEPAPLFVEEGAAILAQAIVFAGAHIGRDVIVGDQSFVRERAAIGAGSVIGRGSCVDFDVMVGERVRIQSMVYVTAHATIEDDVFIGPGVVTTNDHTMARQPPTAPLLGPTLRRACRIGGGAVLVPGIEVGEEAFVAAGAVVTNNVPPRAVVMGCPARVVRQVRDEDLLTPPE
jgi:UDP-2-acetamido-3-amino-2,3-dideoxy-glucuronate N-acetyltransferase